MDLKVKGSSLAGIVSSVEALSTQRGDGGSCDVDFPLFLTIYSANTGLLPPTFPVDTPSMWIPTSSGMWQQVSVQVRVPLSHFRLVNTGESSRNPNFLSGCLS